MFKKNKGILGGPELRAQIWSYKSFCQKDSNYRFGYFF